MMHDVLLEKALNVNFIRKTTSECCQVFVECTYLIRKQLLQFKFFPNTIFSVLKKKKLLRLPDERQIDVWLFIVGGVGVVLATALVNMLVADFLLFVTLFNELMGRLSKNPPKQKRKEKMKALMKA